MKIKQINIDPYVTLESIDGGDIFHFVGESELYVKGEKTPYGVRYLGLRDGAWHDGSHLKKKLCVVAKQITVEY